MSCRRALALCIVLSFLGGCSSAILKYDKSEQLKKNEEFEEAVKIVKPDEPAAAPAGTEAAATPTPAAKTTSNKAPAKTATATAAATATTAKTSKKKGKAEAAKETPAATPASRQPDFEDTEGFTGRRPNVDPFRVGEEVIHDVNYFKVSAGELRLKVEPFSTVNGRKSYTFAVEIKTSSLFSKFYAVDDRVETFVDYEDLVPRVFQLHVKESGQLREAKMLFSPTQATYWEKKVTKDDGEKEKKLQWDLLPYSQNVYSAIYYMRNFKWETGKEYSFRVADDEQNLVFSGKAIRREVLDTKLGPMKAIVIQPKIVLAGKFKPIGDNFIWLSDDDRKYILRIESKIKIGTLVSEVVKINPGK